MTQTAQAMCDEDRQATEQPALDLGAVLREERKAQRLTIGQVASSMRLSDKVVERLETEHGEFADAPVYLRGYLRNYARLLGREELIPTPVDSQVPGNSWQPERGDSNRWQHLFEAVAHRSAYLVATLLIIGTLAAWVYQPGRDAVDGESLVTRDAIGPGVLDDAQQGDATASPRRAQAASMAPLALSEMAPVERNTSPMSSTDLLATAETVQQAVSSDSAPAESTGLDDSGDPGAEQPGPPAAAAETVDSRVLLLKATQDSWVQVEQGEQRLVYDLMTAGTERRVSIDGEMPVTLLLGYAPGMELTWQGNRVDLAPHTREDVARLSLTPRNSQ